MQVKVGQVIIGASYIPIQTMLKNPVTEIEKSLAKIKQLKTIGCDIIRISIPDQKSLTALKQVLKEACLPVVADIHFDYRLAIGSIEAGVHKVRINPGNIGEGGRVKKVIDCLKYYQTPVRIGINKGSLPEHLKKKYQDPIQIMLKAAEEEVSYFRRENYHNIVLSFKSSHTLETIQVNQLARQQFDYPLHIGVTEAGDLIDGAIKNSIGISTLLMSNIGDTIRVSLTAPEEEEVIIGQKILESIDRRKASLEIISCPTCGRTSVDIAQIVTLIKKKIKSQKFLQPVKIAVMGCIVNGPGEAADCDLGVACGKGQSILFSKGKKIKMVKNEHILDELLMLLENHYAEHDQ